MDLLSIVSAIRQHKVIAAAGCAAGIILMLVISLKLERSPSSPFGIGIKARSQTTYESTVQLLISGPGFGIGRAGAYPGQPDIFRRTVDVAPTYAILVSSDTVLSRVRSRTGDLDAVITGEAAKDSPVVTVKVQSPEAATAVLTAATVGTEFAEYVKEEQDHSDVPSDDRLYLRALTTPTPAMPLRSRAVEVAILALLVPIAASIGIALVIENFHGTSATLIEARLPEAPRQVRARVENETACAAVKEQHQQRCVEQHAEPANCGHTRPSDPGR